MCNVVMVMECCYNVVMVMKCCYNVVMVMVCCQVLPRQTCRLFTHNYNVSNFPGGHQRLDLLAQGGEVFNYLLNAPVSGWGMSGRE